MESERTQHLNWCKQRALQYCDLGDIHQAWASMSSDMSKHPETQYHPALELGTMLFLAGHNNNPQSMRKFIEGFN